MSARAYGAAKRAIDATAAALGLVLLSPLLLGIAVLVLLETGRPVLFRQSRAGLGGDPFPMVKFRTMRVSGEFAGDVDTSAWADGVPDDFVFKSSGSAQDRVTRVGAWLRRTSLDELPQLVNVLAGHMSLVGPRPEILPIVRHYSAEQAHRLLVKPGVTGWAQVTGRSSHDHGEKMRADRYYVDHACLSLDLRIIARTIGVAFGGKEAY